MNQFYEWKKVTSKEYDNEQKNPFSFGGSDLCSLCDIVKEEKDIKIKPSIYIKSGVNRKFGKEKLPVVIMNKLLKNGNFKNYTYTPKIKHVKKNYNSLDALNFGKLFHCVCLEREKFYNLYKVDKESNLLTFTDWTYSYTNLVLSSQQASFLHSVASMYDQYLKNLGIKKESLINEEPFLCKFSIKTKDINPSIRCKPDSYYIEGDTLNLIDLKTVKCYDAFLKNVKKYKTQLFLYSSFLLDMGIGVNVKKINLIIIYYDKHSNKFFQENELCILDNDVLKKSANELIVKIQNLIENIEEKDYTAYLEE